MLLMDYSLNKIVIPKRIVIDSHVFDNRYASMEISQCFVRKLLCTRNAMQKGVPVNTQHINYANQKNAE